MNVDQLLRESAPSPTRLREHTERLRADVLTRSTGTRESRSRRPVRVGLAVAALASVGVGGVAYATGSVPAFVTSLVQDAGRELHVPRAQQPDMEQFVDLEMPDGTRFAAWRGVSDGMWCTAYTDRWDGHSQGGGGAGCGDGGQAGFELNRTQVAWARDTGGKAYRGVIFGEAKAGEVEARITGRFAGTGQPVELTVPIDPATQGFAAVLPGTTRDPWGYLAAPEATIRAAGLTVQLLDADGAVLRTVQDLYA